MTLALAFAPAACPAACSQRQQQRRAAAASSSMRSGLQQRVQQQRQQQRRRQLSGGAAGRLAVQASSTYGSEWATPKDSYLTVGLAHCYVKGDDGKLRDQYVIEPITANSLECMANGAKTSFMHVFGLKLEEALERSRAALPAEFGEGVFCEEWEARCDACARTWMRPHALDNLLDIVPLGQLKSSFNYSTVDKRVLNMENVVNDDDNVKQDLSIDVYGRKAKEEAAAKVSGGKAAAAAKEEDEEEPADDMDALLSI